MGNAYYGTTRPEADYRGALVGTYNFNLYTYNTGSDGEGSTGRLGARCLCRILTF